MTDMNETCSHECESCGEECEERTEPKTRQGQLVKPHDGTNIKKIIGVVSGKGGVGKSLVTSLLAVMAQRKGFTTAIMDADITGPSIPRAFGLRARAQSDSNGIYPVETQTGIRVMSLNVLTKDETEPVVWRGPMIAGAVGQFWTEVVWGDVDYMFIDMPPGTGDVPLTVFQSIPVDGIVIVASPQELVGMIVEKAVNMADMMGVPILAVVENMSYVLCPDCGRQIRLFGEGHIDQIAQRHDIDLIAKLPIDPQLASACDMGGIEMFAGNWLSDLFEQIQDKLDKKDAAKASATACQADAEHASACGGECCGNCGSCGEDD